MAIYGGQNYPTNIHYSGFTEESLKEMLREVGFGAVKRFKPFVEDTTRFTVQGVPMSLNLHAVKEFCPKKPGFHGFLNSLFRKVS